MPNHGTGLSSVASISELPDSMGFIAVNDSTRVLVIDNACLVPGMMKIFNRQENEGTLRGLEMKHCYVDYAKRRVFEAKIFRELLDVFAFNPKLESIKMWGPFPRHQDDVASIAQILRGSQHLQEISLLVPEDNRVPFGQHLKVLARSCPQLRSITLESFNWSDARSVPNLKETLKDSQSLQELSLSGDRVTDEVVWKLLHGAELERIHKFQLPGCPLSIVSLLIVAALVNLNTNLRLLDLSGCDGIFVKQALQLDNGTVQVKTALKMFVLALQRNNTLLELRLSECGITDEVFFVILQSLSLNPSLKTLDLDYNRITRGLGVVHHLRAALPKLGLWTLSLRGLKNFRGESDKSKWSHKELDMFIEALEKNTDLVSLTLDSSKQHVDIFDILARNKRFQGFHKVEDAINSGVKAVSKGFENLVGVGCNVVACTNRQASMRREVEVWMDATWNNELWNAETETVLNRDAETVWGEGDDNSAFESVSTTARMAP